MSEETEMKESCVLDNYGYNYNESISVMEMRVVTRY